MSCSVKMYLLRPW